MMAIDDESILSTHPSFVLNAATAILAFLALSPSPSFIPLVLLLGTLIFHTRVIARGRDPRRHHHYQISQHFIRLGCLSVGTAASHVSPSTSALSSPVLSIVLLLGVSLVSAIAALIPVYGHAWYYQRLNPWAKVTLFPALWSATWVAASKGSPLGRMGTWSPLSGVESYEWIRAYLGAPGLDWIVAGWAVIGAQLAEFALLEEPGVVLNGPPEGTLVEADAVDYVRPPSPPPPQPREPLKKALFYLTVVLLAATLPSFTSDLPSAPRADNTTPLAVACILPPPATKESEFDRYLSETKRNGGRAKILLWPEGAVRFDNESERTQALAQVAVVTKQYGVWIGATFDEVIPVSGHGGRPGLRRTGLALVGPDGQLDIEYYKRHLVPLVESFSNVASTVSPPVYNLPLPPPSHIKAPQWAEGPNFTRPIPLTPLICLDASHEIPSLSEPPALILAPAHTWHPAVGQAMFQLARARANELNAKIIWCDGGHGAVGGLAGDGERDMQVGEGTWVKTIGIPWPFKHSRTMYAIIGDVGAIVILWLIVTGGGSGVEHVMVTGVDWSWVMRALEGGWQWTTDSASNSRLAQMLRRWRERNDLQAVWDDPE
ncbi:hypothetical protein BOTBODRAFT_155856 [Botryobasidium botryosum FD-172 SS1]|uniref:CN hydrolase domain-containing protein n=1 Tax=Botryobasidium botryosum (strain FD-172 SS1) TaxID=930990 RepID=A0A067N0T7_BOTB1|nr:hypothetical protein BOTBODRAFT_155856 [Botryobasidium botryosum FD-172 SS1]